MIYHHADADQPNMGLTSWKDAPQVKTRKFDVVVAKNYLTEVEMAQLSRVVNAYLDVADDITQRKIPMTMQDWETRLNRFIEATDREVLLDAGTRRSTRWCWPCLCPGRARCSSTLDACTGSTLARPTCGSSISWTLATWRCGGCGTNGRRVTGLWDTGSAPMALRNYEEFSRGSVDFCQSSHRFPLASSLPSASWQHDGIRFKPCHESIKRLY